MNLTVSEELQKLKKYSGGVANVILDDRVMKWALQVGTTGRLLITQSYSKYLDCIHVAM